MSAAPHINVRAIIEVLRTNGISALSERDVDPALATVASIRGAIDKSDMFLVALDMEGPDPNVFFELGYARGVGKPVVALISPGVRPLPQVALDVPYFVTDLAAHASMDSAIRQYLRAPTKSMPQPPAQAQVVRDRAIGRTADRLLKRLGERPISAQAVEEIVNEALTATGNLVERAPVSTALSRADFAVWGDSFDLVVGNPLLVEVKRSIQHDDAFRSVDRLLEANARAILVLYAEGNPPLRWFETGANSPLRLLLFMQIEDFLRQLKRVPLSRVLIDARNRLVHGAP